MPVAVGVSLRNPDMIHYFEPGSFKLKQGDMVVVQTSKGVEIGQVMVEAKEVNADKIEPASEVLRIATEEDLRDLKENQVFEANAKVVAQQKADEHGLEMRFVKVEKMFDNSKAIFYFSAENRVDFRQLVKDLAAEFKTRIELRQVGVRDKARLIGGLGPCGCRLCCTVFLKEFEPVSIKMAKDQDLPLNPLKISGACGRLMCCLHYENDFYQQFKSRVPQLGRCVQTSYGVGRIVEHNAIKETVRVEYEDKRLIEHSLNEIEAACNSNQTQQLEKKLGRLEESEALDLKLKELEDV